MNRPPRLRVALLAAACGLLPLAPAPAQTGGLVPAPLERLDAPPVSRLGQAALAISPAKWLHAETENFAYHYSASRPANEAAVEAEFYYSFFAKELGRSTADWQRKGHIFIFEEEADWRQFQEGARLDPWTGGIHANNELFIFRPSANKFGGGTLAHETAHLVLFRFFGPGIPLWLNEGYAEYAGMRAWASWQRMRGFNARPRSRPVSEEALIPLSEFVLMTDYPGDQGRARVFYNQSERLVRFLSAADKSAFVSFLDFMARGNRFETALAKAFGARFPAARDLEREFTAYVSQEFAASLGGGKP